MNIEIQDNVVIVDGKVFKHNEQHSLECIMKGCPNKRTEGNFVGDLCLPCHRAITNGDFNEGRGIGVVGQLFRENYKLKTVKPYRLDFDLEKINPHSNFARDLYDMCWYYSNSLTDIRVNWVSPDREAFRILINAVGDIMIEITIFDFEGNYYEVPNTLIQKIKTETEILISVAENTYKDEDYHNYHELIKKYIHGA